MKRFLNVACALVTLIAGRLSAQGGVLSAVQAVPVTAAKSTALTITVISGGTQTLAGITDGAVNSFASPVRITTSWDLVPSTGSVTVVAYFSTPAQALANGTDFIASSRIKGRVTTGTPVAFTAFSQNAVGGAGSAGGSLRLFSVAILGNNRQASRTDNLDLQLDLTGQPALVPGTYSGVLNVRAVTQ